MAPSANSLPANAAPPLLLSAISTLPSSPLSANLATRIQFSCLLFSCLFHGPPNHSTSSPKAIARGLGSVSASASSGGNFFVPADGGAPPTQDEEDDEPPSSLLQLVTEHLSLSMLARSRCSDNQGESRLWDRVIVGYLVLLATWLWDDPKGVRVFLEGGGVGVVSSS